MRKQTGLSNLQVEVRNLGISGNGISGNGIEGNGISGNGIEGNGISGNGIDCMELNLDLEKEFSQLKK